MDEYLLPIQADLVFTDLIRIDADSGACLIDNLDMEIHLPLPIGGNG